MYETKVTINGEEQTVEHGEVTYKLEIMNSGFFPDGDTSWVAQQIHGLPTEDTDLESPLDETNEEGFTTCDGETYYDPDTDEIVLTGKTAFHGQGESIETRTPVDAVTLEWNGDPSDREKEKFRDHFGRDPPKSPTLDTIQK